MTEHLVNRAIDAHGVERENPEHHETQVTNRRIGNYALEVGLHHGDQRAVDDPDYGQRHEQRNRLDRDGGKQRNRETQKAVGAHLEHHAREDHRARRGRVRVSVRQPGMHMPHRSLDRERQRERREQPAGFIHSKRHLVEQRQIEAGAVEMHVRLVHQVQNRDQHEKRSNHREQHELDGGVNLAAMSPNADQEVHRNQHHFPEHVEQEQIDRKQRAEQPGLEHQHEEAELARPLFDIAAAGIKNRQGNQDSSQKNQKQTNAVNTNMVRNVERGNPVVLLDELVIRLLRIELIQYIEAQRERKQREDERRVPDRTLFALHENEERADQRQENQSREPPAVHPPVNRNR